MRDLAQDDVAAQRPRHSDVGTPSYSSTRWSMAVNGPAGSKVVPDPSKTLRRTRTARLD